MTMVSLDHAAKYEGGGLPWMVVLVTVASTVSMVTAVVYCACCNWLLNRTPKPPSLSSLKFPDPAKKKLTAGQKGASPATGATHSQSVQPETEKKSKVKKKKEKKASLGRLQLHIHYAPSRSVLEVTIMCAQALPAKDVSGTSDPYCKLLLLPVKDKKISTKVKDRTLNPVWNEKIRFTVSPSELPEQTLYVYVLDHDVMNQDDMIGECRVNLRSLDHLARGQMMWRELRPCEGYASHLGEILVSLCYSASQEKLTIGILKCTNLRAMDKNNSSDPYVKIFLWKQMKKHGKQKTRTITKNLNPVFNESFSYEVSLTKIHSTRVLIEVMDYDRMSANDKIGCVMLGEVGEGSEVMHWNEMCSHMDKPIAAWHRLQETINQ